MRLLCVDSGDNSNSQNGNRVNVFMDEINGNQQLNEILWLFIFARDNFVQIFV